jgi:hypothetical protein
VPGIGSRRGLIALIATSSVDLRADSAFYHPMEKEPQASIENTAGRQ